MEFKNISLTFRDDNICVLTVNRPNALNALNKDTLTELNQAADKIHSVITTSTKSPVGGNQQEPVAEPRLIAMVLTGGGEKAFIAGADISEMQKMTRSEAVIFSQLGHQFAKKLGDLSIPTIAAVNGFALGGGMEMAVACDYIYASPKAVFGQPEVGLGVLPGFGGTFRVAQYLGWPTAKELIFSGRKMNAEEAQRRGLVVEILSESGFLDQVIEKVKGMGKNSGSAIKEAKKLMNLLAESQGTNFKMDAESQAFGTLFGERDQIEGMNAFLEKRKPRF